MTTEPREETTPTTPDVPSAEVGGSPEESSGAPNNHSSPTPSSESESEPQASGEAEPAQAPAEAPAPAEETPRRLTRNKRLRRPPPERRKKSLASRIRRALPSDAGSPSVRNVPTRRSPNPNRSPCPRRPERKRAAILPLRRIPTKRPPSRPQRSHRPAGARRYRPTWRKNFKRR